MTDEERMRQIESSLMSPSMRGTRLSHLAIGGLPVGIALVALSRADIGDRLSFGGGADADDTDTESDDAEGGDEAPSSGVAATSSAAPRAMAGAWQWRVAVAFGSGSGVWQWRVAVAYGSGSGSGAVILGCGCDGAVAYHHVLYVGLLNGRARRAPFPGGEALRAVRPGGT
jgi:hypothetical protein